MANSYEIAQMFSQQNAMFMGQQQFAQQIGVPAPPFMGRVGFGGAGIGSTNMGMGGNRGGGFNYGPSGAMGYGPGNQFATKAMSGAGTMMEVGSMGLGAASMLGLGNMGGVLGAAGKIGSLMDPFAMGARGFAMGGMAGGMAGFAAPVFAGMAVSHSIGSMIQGGQQQGQLNSMLGSQYQQFNPAVRSGAGFSRDDAKSIGDMTRSLSHVPEMMTSFDELTKIMAKMKSNGTMQGVRSAADFQARFREAVSTIRETAKVLGTTMEEAEQFFSHSRGAGFFGRSSQLRNVNAVQFTSGVTGATIGQVAAMQQSGADMAMSFGARRGLGAAAVTNIAQNIGLAQAGGRLREGAIEDVTGMSGPEGALALSQKMYQGMMAFGRSPAGRLAMAGMMKFEGGKAIGVDEDMVRRFNNGEVTNQELMGRASRLTNDQKISFQARQGDLMSSLAGQVGPGGMYGMMKRTLQGAGYQSPEAVNLLLQRQTGLSAGELDIAQGMEGVSGEGMEGAMARLRQSQAQIKERTSPDAILRKIKARIHGATFGKLEALGASIHTSLAKSVDDFIDEQIGSTVSALTDDRAKAIAQAFSGSNSKDAVAMMKSFSAGPSGLGKGGGEGMIARGLAGLSGEMTSGQEGEALRRLVGDGSGIAALKAGKGGGAGGGAAISEILSQGGDDLAAKSGVQKMDAISSKLKMRIEQIRNIEIARGRFGGSLLKPLSAADKSLLDAYDSAAKNPVGGVSPEMQIIAKALGTNALNGLGIERTSLAQAQSEFRAAGDAVNKSLGAAGVGFASTEDKKKALLASIGDEDIKLRIQNGDLAGAQELLASRGVKINSKDMPALKEAVNGFVNATMGKDSAKAYGDARKALDAYKSSGDRLALGEARNQLSSKGQDLINAAGGGRTGELQKTLGEALKKGPDGGFEKAFGEYSAHIGSLKGKELEDALASGGSMASRALAASQKNKSFANTIFKNSKQVQEAFGVTESDVTELAGSPDGRKLTADQIKKLALRGGASQSAIEALSKPQDAVKSKEDRLIETLNLINDTQRAIATALKVDVKDLPKPVRTTPDSSADKNGNAAPGR